MKTLEDIGLNRNVSKQLKNKFVIRRYTMPLSDIKKTLLLDNIPKLLSIFGLSGFCFSIGYLLLCPFCCPDRWVIALFQIILFGAIYYIGDKNAIS